MNPRPIPHICQKTRKGDFGVRKENVEDFNIQIIKWIQTNEITLENIRKKDLSVIFTRFLCKDFSAYFLKHGTSGGVVVYQTYGLQIGIEQCGAKELESALS